MSSRKLKQLDEALPQTPPETLVSSVGSVGASALQRCPLDTRTSGLCPRALPFGILSTFPLASLAHYVRAGYFTLARLYFSRHSIEVYGCQLFIFLIQTTQKGYPIFQIPLILYTINFKRAIANYRFVQSERALASGNVERSAEDESPLPDSKGRAFGGIKRQSLLCHMSSQMRLENSTGFSMLIPSMRSA